MFIFLVQKCHTLLLLVLFYILSFGFLFFHVHHLCMPLLGPELVNKILVSCIGPLYHLLNYIKIEITCDMFSCLLCLTERKADKNRLYNFGKVKKSRKWLKVRC